MQLSAVPDAASHHLFPAFLELLEPAVTDGSPAFDEAIDTLWIAYEDGIVWGAATTRLRTDGVARLRLASGKRFRDWMGLLDDAVTQWAGRCGCTRVVMSGRKGWSRYADRFGWASTGTDQDGLTEYEKRL